MFVSVTRMSCAFGMESAHASVCMCSGGVMIANTLLCMQVAVEHSSEQAASMLLASVQEEVGRLHELGQVVFTFT
jgi:hypothetical protein